VFAVSGDEEMQPPALPCQLQIENMERLEQVQRRMRRWCATALARSQIGDEIWRKAMQCNIGNKSLQ